MKNKQCICRKEGPFAVEGVDWFTNKDCSVHGDQPKQLDQYNHPVEHPKMPEISEEIIQYVKRGQAVREAYQRGYDEARKGVRRRSQSFLLNGDRKLKIYTKKGKKQNKLKYY